MRERLTPALWPACWKSSSGGGVERALALSGGGSLLDAPAGAFLFRSHTHTMPSSPPLARIPDGQTSLNLHLADVTVGLGVQRVSL